MTLDHDTLSILAEALEKLDDGFSDLPDYTPQVDRDAVRAVLLEVAERMQDNYPYQHPFYAGQMLKPPHPMARLAYALAQYINPNNHALDGGKASSHMEKEAVAQIAALFGWKQHLGHLTGGGTLANLEALWAARELHPGKKVVASEQAHYTHSRISEVIGLSFEAIPVDGCARMDMDALEAALQTGEVGTVVVTMGTTATGSVDPLPQVIALQAKYGFRIHADAAYGGYFTLADNLDADARAAFDCLDRGRFARHRSAQTRLAALWLWLHPVPRSGGRQALRAQFALYLLHLRRTAFGRDQPRMLTRRGVGGGAVGDHAACCRSNAADSLPPIWASAGKRR